MSTKKRRFVVEYGLPYEHRVQVGIQAAAMKDLRGKKEQ